MYPFERFTADAKRTLTLAQEEAERSHHNYIGTEHLLLALLRLESGPAHDALQQLGIGVASVRHAVANMIGRDEPRIFQQIIPTSRVKTVIEIAFREGHAGGHAEVSSGHLLMALAIEGEGIAAHVLADLGADREKVVEAARRAIEAGPTARAPLRVIDPQRFREVMASFTSGVVVLTAFGEDGRPRGLTVSAFCAISLEPPLALVCIDKTSNTLPAVQRTGGFTANILAAGREGLARRMATKLSDKFDWLVWKRTDGPIGGPILKDDTAAYAVCVLRDTIEAGDHWVLIGLVIEGDHREGVTPMVFTRRAYG